MNNGFIVVFNERDSMMIVPKNEQYRYYILINGQCHAGGMISDPHLESPIHIAVHIRRKIEEKEGRDVYQWLSE